MQDGYLMAGCDNFRLTVHGKAAHGSRPDEGCDAIVAASMEYESNKPEQLELL